MAVTSMPKLLCSLPTRPLTASRSHSKWAAWLSPLCLLAACATNPAIDTAREHWDAGRPEEALVVLDQASKAAPNNHIYRAEYFRQRELAIAQWLAQAETLRQSGQIAHAQAAYQRILKYDDQNARARAGMAQIDNDLRNNRIVAEAEALIKTNKFLEAQDLLRPVLSENPAHREARRLQRVIEDKTVKPAIVTPRLKTTSNKPISLDVRDLTLRAVFDVISRSTGLSFMFDKDVRPDLRATINIRDANVEELIRFILVTNQLEQKLVNETTLLIYPNTPQKQREYQELVIKSFYLANADVKQTANMIRTLVKTRDIFIDEKLNMVVIRDTPNAIRMAEKLIMAQDLADPEVMLEVEVLEVSTNRLVALGLQYPSSLAISLQGGGTTSSILNTTGSTISQSTTPGTPGQFSLTQWLGSPRSQLVQILTSNPFFAVNLQQTNGATNVLANPRIRVRNKEKAKIHIGDRVPVFTTTAAATGGFVSSTVTYLDVGLKLEVEPVISLDDEVGMKVGLEVSNIVKEVPSKDGNTLAYQIGTRNTTTALRLKDGETQILAGLISDEDRRSATGIPGLVSLPVVNRLFGNTNSTSGKTEIMLLITPRLLRTLARPEARLIEFSAGTEASTGAAPGFINPPIGLPQPFTPQPAPKPEAKPPVPVPGAQVPTPQTVPAAPTIVPFGGLQAPKP